MLKTFKLSNGIQVATYDLPNLRSIHIRVSVKGGSIVEYKKNNGISHFMEHLLVQGTPSYKDVEQFSSLIESLAGNYSAYTENLLIGFSLTLPTIELQTGIKLASEVIFEPLFSIEGLERERGAIMSEIKQKMDSHWFKIGEFFYKTRFKEGHPLTLNTAGTPEVIQNLTREDIINFWKKYFVPKNTYVLVSGKFREGDLKNFLEEYFGQYKSEDDFPGYPKMSLEDFSKKQVVIREDQNLGACYIDLTVPSISLDDSFKERVTQNIATIILGGLRNSRLFKLLRYQKGLVYSVGSGSNIDPGLGYLYIDCQVSLESLDEVVKLIMEELVKFTENGPTEEDLQLVKNYLSHRWMMAFDHPSAIASWIENDLLWNDKIRLPEEYIEVLQEVTVEDIKSLMQTYWDFSKLNLSVQGPIKDKEKKIKEFEKIINYG